MPDHMEVGRAHQEVGGFRVEFETFPGRLHEGTEATVRFWVMEAPSSSSIRPSCQTFPHIAI